MGGALLLYVAAALAEIAGCFSFWAWARLGRSVFWLVPGMLSLAAFAWVLTRIDADFAGRAYAAYGGVYIAVSRLAVGSGGFASRPLGLCRSRPMSDGRRGDPAGTANRMMENSEVIDV